MIEIKQYCLPSIDRVHMEHFNRVEPAYQRDSLYRVNLRKPFAEQAAFYAAPAYPKPNNTYPYSSAPAPARQQPYAPYQSAPIPMPTTPAPMPAPAAMTFPPLDNPLRRGQKAALSMSGHVLELGFGWNVSDGRVDVDASAFMLTDTNRVPSDDWFVFYSHPESPDGSVQLKVNAAGDRQTMTVDLSRIDSSITRIAFVLTINEAVEQHLHFGMIREAYVRVMEHGRTLASYRPEELNSSITAMAIAELYYHNGQWKLNPVGNGVNRDLAGLCAFYGVEIV